MERHLNLCRQCPLFHRGYVPGEGPTPSPVMMVGQSPGEDESFRSHRPFTGKAGKDLDVYLHRAGIERGLTYITNLIKCNPPDNRAPSDEEIALCSRHLQDEMEEVRPTVVVTLGAEALDFFLPGEWLERAWGIPYTLKGYFVFPIYHPALGQHQTEMMTHIDQGFRRLKAWMEGKEVWKEDQHPHPDYWIPGPMTGELVHPTLVAVDTETRWDGGPLYLQISAREGRGSMVMAHDPWVVSRVKRILEDPTVTTILHNAMFDLDILHQMDIHPSHVEDTMVMAYLLQDLPQSLKSLAYRLAGMEMDEYHEVLGDAPEQKALSYLQEVVGIDWPTPAPVVEYKGGNVSVRQPQEVGRKVRRALADFAEGKAKSLVDRWFKMEGKEEVEAVIGPMPGADLRDIEWEKTLHYACRDADATFRIYSPLMARIREEKLEDVFKADMSAIPMVIDMQRNGILIDPPKFKEISAMFKARMREIEGQIEKTLGYPINPGSPPQVAEMMGKQGIKGKVRIGKSGQRSTSIQVLEPLKDQHPVVAAILEWRKYETLKTSFADTIPLKAGADGRVRTTLRVTRVVTGRLSSSNPNLMAQPVRTGEARMVRDGFLAEPGWVLVSNDYSQVEMRVTAHCSQDPAMMEVFSTGQDIHSNTASRMFGLPIPQLDEMLHRYPAKRTGFGILNVISPDGLLREMETGGAKGWTRDKCESMIKDWFSIYSGVKIWIEDSKASARRYGKVWDLFGRFRLVPEVWSSDSRIVEDGLRQAVNAPIQMGAQGIIKRAMGSLYEFFKGAPYIRWLIQIHDDILMEVRKEEVEWVLPVVKMIMEGAASLSIPTPVDQKVGERWGSMEKTG